MKISVGLPFKHLSILGCATAAVIVGAWLATSPLARAAGSLQTLPGHVPAAARTATPLSRMDPGVQMNLAIGLPLRNAETLTNLLQQLYDPSSLNFRHYLTPAQFTEQFGPSLDDCLAVSNHMVANGLTVTAVHPNRMIIDVSGSVSSVERVLNVQMGVYQHPTENRTFYAPNVEPSLNLTTPVLHVSGLDNFLKPRPMNLRKSSAGTKGGAVTGVQPDTSSQGTGTGGRKPIPMIGSGPGGAYIGNDFRTAYAPGVTLTGTGQSVALFELDGYYLSDILAYESLAGLPNVPLVNVLLDGFDGIPVDPNANGEVSLDIEMVVSMAPGLSSILMYETLAGVGQPNDLLNRMATDDLANQISSSWGFGIDATTEQIFQQYIAQGQAYFNASGDFDAWVGPIFPPSDDPNIISVGGTTLSTSSAGGPWSSETVWNDSNNGNGVPGIGSSGGISTTYSIPTWQAAVNMSASKGSTTMRNIPDVAMTADNIFTISDNGLQDPGVQGTSAATPLWAAFTALVNQQAANGGEPPVGFINPAIYSIGLGPGYNLAFHDITTGNNTNPASPNLFFAVPGYDLCTGWGSPNGSNMINALAAPKAIALPVLNVVGSIVSGGNGNGLIDADECNSFQVILGNAGTAGATNVQATLSTATPGVFVVNKTQSFPNIPVGSTATNLTPFEVSTSPKFAIGTPIQFNLLIKIGTLAVTRAFTVQTGNGTGTPVRFDSTTVVNIPDNSPRGTNSIITVTNVIPTLQHVSVSLNILHPAVSDLTLQLIGPDGTTVLLSGTNGLTGQNYGSDCQDADRTVFDDFGSFPIDFGTAPFIGTFQPDSPLAVFNGKSGDAVNGAWKLHVIDRVSGNVGTIQCWSLFLTPTPYVDGGGSCPGVDLAVSLASSPAPAMVGSPMTYNIQVVNNGPNDAHAVSVSQSLPSGVTYNSSSASQGAVSQAGGVVNASLGTVAAGDSATVAVVVTPNTAGTLFSTANVGTSDNDIVASNNSVTIGSVVNPPMADLALGLTASPNPVLVGGVLNYTMSVTNNGPATAANVVVSNVLPASVGILSASSSQGSSINNGNTIVTSLGTIVKGGSASVAIAVFPSIVGSITDTAAVSSTTADPLPGNNSASVTAVVSPAADLSVNMVSVPASAVVGSNVSYLILVSNHGPSPAANVSVSDTLPSGVTLVSATNSSGQSFPKVGQTVTFTATNLPVNGSALFSLTVGTASLASQVPLYITNTAAVSSAAADPNLANNGAVVATRIDSARPAIVGAGARLVSESIQPTNGFIDPGETVTVLLNLQNIGNVSTTNLVATLQSGGGVNLTAGAQVQAYGALGVGAVPVGRQFTFTAGTNVSAIIATLKLQDGSSNLGSVSFTFPYPTVSNFVNISNIVIPDHGEASPYPSSILVSGVSGLIDKVTVSLTNFNHTYPDDVDVLLVGPAGQTTLLMSHCGQGGIATNVSLTFDDTAAASLTTLGQLTSGTFKPTQNGSVSFPVSNTPAGPYGAALSVFNGTNANGLWSLYVFDSSPGDQGIILGGWSLGITAGTPVNQIVDLSVAGSGAPNPVLAGNNITYTFTITNNGPNTANAVAFTNMLAPGVSFVSVNSSQGTYGVDANGAVYCTLTNLPVGVSVTVNVVGTPTIPGTITNLATITSIDTDLNQFNNTAAVVTTVTAPVADVAVTMGATPNPVALGGNVTYTVTVTNAGPGVALGVIATVPLGNQSFVTGIGFSNVSGNAICQVGALAAGSGTVLSFVATPSQLGLVTSTVTGTTYSSDTNSANNSASVGVNVVPPSPNVVVASASLLSESFLPPNGSIDPGETVNVAFKLANVGTAYTTNLFVTLLAANGITPLNGPFNNGVLAPGGAPITYTFEFTLAPTNVGSVTALLQLQDGGANLGTLSYTFNLPATNTLANSGLISIPDSGAATPYPSTINVSGLTGVVSKATVTLNGFGHQFPNDVEILLVGPSGAKTVLMSGAGGAYSVRSANITLDDSAAVTLPSSALITNGTYKPTENTLTLPFPSPAPAGPYVASLGTFNGTAPNGTWALYVFDNSPGDSGAIVGGWSLNLVTVSPVNGTADLNIAASSIAGPYVPGSNFVCNVSVANSGPDSATGVTLTDVVPSGWNVTGSVPAYASLVGGVMTFNLGQIAAGSGTNVSITFNAPVSGLFTNAFNVQASQFDFTPGNNAVATTTLIQAPLILTGSAYATNNVFTFTLTGGLPNTSYVVLASPDFTTWTPVSTNTTSGAGTFQFQDPNAGTYGLRYYRARVGP